MDIITIAVDGPAGAGKSTISKRIAKRLNIEYVDTGAMYRAVTLKMIESGVRADNTKEIMNILNNTEIHLKESRIFMDGRDVSEDIRKPEISENVSAFSAIPEVRLKLVEMQREMSRKNSVIMDGRDIGSNVLKDAVYKIYLNASIEERAQRRMLELNGKGYSFSLEEIKDDILSRDIKDMGRAVNPLIKVDDAVEIDTTGKTIEEVVEEIVQIVEKGRK